MYKSTPKTWLSVNSTDKTSNSTKKSMKFWTIIASKQTLINMKATGYREGSQKSFGKNFLPPIFYTGWRPTAIIYINYLYTCMYMWHTHLYHIHIYHTSICIRMFKSCPKKWEAHTDVRSHHWNKITITKCFFCFLEVCNRCFVSSLHVKVIVWTHMRIHGPLFILNMQLKTIFKFTVQAEALGKQG